MPVQPSARHHLVDKGIDFGAASRRIDLKPVN